MSASSRLALILLIGIPAEAACLVFSPQLMHGALAAARLNAELGATATLATLKVHPILGLVRAVFVGAFCWIPLFWRELLQASAAGTAQSSATRKRIRSAAAFHAACLLGLVFFEAKIGLQLDGWWSRIHLAAVAYFSLVLGLVASALALWAPLRFWRNHFFVAHRGVLLVFALGLILSYGVGLDSYTAEAHVLNLLFEPTARGAARILGWWHYAAVVDAPARVITVDQFAVKVSFSCLGYQGMLIAGVVLCTYMYRARAALVFPAALLILPAVLATLFATNCLRIATLLAIGASWSPEVAVNGFHSAAGIVNLFFVLLAAIVALNRLPCFARQPARLSLDLSAENARMAPFVLLTAISILTLLGTARFEWLYPLKVLGVGALLFATRSRLGLERPTGLTWPVAVGVAVFVLWLMLVPEVPPTSALFEATLFAAPAWISVPWLVFRVIGAIVIVPAAEELAFRGYWLPDVERRIRPWIGSENLRQLAAVGLTALAFGLLHSAWLAGLIAGVAYGVLRVATRSVSDCVVAHAVTNLLLAAYVIHYGAWSYW